MANDEFPPFGGPPVGFDTTPGKAANDAVRPVAERSTGEQLNSVLGRVRDLERRFADVQDLLRFHEEESRKNVTRLWTKVKESDARITELSHQLAELDQQVHLMVNEIRLTAKKEDFEVIKRFVEYIKPVKFVTVDQVERIVKDILEDQGAVKEKVIEE